jgi:hypothetical protein
VGKRFIHSGYLVFEQSSAAREARFNQRRQSEIVTIFHHSSTANYIHIDPSFFWLY